MMFNDQVKAVNRETELQPPSKRHVFYWLKWQFVVKPKLLKAMAKAEAQMVDDILNGDILRKRIDKK